MTSSTLPEAPSILPLGIRNGLHLNDQLEGIIILSDKPTILGGYSDVYEGLWRRSSGEEVPVAIKVLRQTWVRGPGPINGLTPGQILERRTRRETSIWNAVRHENILRFIGYQIIEGIIPRLVSPLCKNGNLQTYIKANPDIIYTERLALLRDAARGLAYLHGFVPPIAHGSIHPTEILVTDDVRGVLCDFGDSRVVTNVHTGFTTSTSTISGRKGFMSKELIDGSTSLPTPMGDVYGLGGTILFVMTGKTPFYQLRTHAQAMIAVAFEDATPNPGDHSELPESDPLWSLMRKCWDGEPSRRPSTPQIVYKINLILDCGSGFTVPFRRTTINAPDNALPDSEESVVQPGVSVPSLPPPIPGALAMVEYVGGGGYGEVHRGYWTPPGKEPIPVAIKRLKIGKVGLAQTQDNGVLMRRIRRETVIWKAAEHSNILRFYGHQLVDGNPMLVSAWCKNGDLWSFLSNHPKLTRKERLKLLCGAGKGLAHLHSLHPPICHGDIKPQNVIISDEMQALLCDFGISRIVTNPGITEMTTFGEATGTPGFGAKEVLEGSGPTEKGDVYAFGGLILATISGKRPFYTKPNNNFIIFAIFSNETPKPADYPQIPTTDPLWVLMNKCWDPEPSQRPSIIQVVAELQDEIGSLSALDSAQETKSPGV